MDQIVNDSGITREEIQSRRHPRSFKGDHRLLGHGVNAAPERCCCHSGSREPAAHERTHRSPRCRALPSARPFQRTRRSHRGHLGAPTTAFLDRMEEGLGFQLPRHHGYDVVEAIQAMMDESVDVFVCMGEFPISNTGYRPDRQRPEQRGFDRTNFHELNRSHLVTGKNALILPCLGRTEIDVQQSGEQFVTVENSMGVVHRSTGGLTPASPDLRSEPSIVASLAEATLSSTDIDWSGLADDYDRVRDLMERSLDGFDDYNTRACQSNGFSSPTPSG